MREEPDRAERIINAVTQHRADCRKIIEAELRTALEEERQAIIRFCQVLQEGTRGGFAEEILDEVVIAIRTRSEK